MLIEGNNIAGGAVYSQRPGKGFYDEPFLLLATKDKRGMGMSLDGMATLTPLMSNSINPNHYTVNMGIVNNVMLNEGVWLDYHSKNEYYAAIVEKRY